MKKIIFICLLAFYTFNLQAQKSSISFDFGYRPGVENIAKWGLGVQYRYNIFENFKVVPDVMFYRDNSDVGLDANINLSYLFKLNNKATIYPFTGLNMSNHLYEADGGSPQCSDWGINTGLGLEYKTSTKGFLNLDFKYTFLFNKHLWSEDFPLIRLGYGFKF